MKYEKLFSPIKINNVIARNRIVATPTGKYFEDKAKGGAGIVICGSCIVDPGRSSFSSPDETYIFDKYSVEEARSRIRKCHQGGALASLELIHSGQYARVKDYAISSMGFIREDGVEVKQMDYEMMCDVAKKYAKAARDAKDLGFDMVFLHFGHGWLPSQFLSPLFNKRKDEYGGSFENRAKFPLMILKQVRDAVGKNFAVDMRISAIEYVPGSIKFEDSMKFAILASEYVDAIQISSGLDLDFRANVHMTSTNYSDFMLNTKYSKEIKKHINIPVSVVGGNMYPAFGEKILENEEADMVAYGRSFIADPDWPRKVIEGREDDIVPCIRCNQCYHISTNRRNVGCSVNPIFTNESFLSKEITEPKVKKNIIVIGAGPAGIMFSLRASERGHNVTLIEKENEIGGVLNLVSKEYYKREILTYLEYLKHQISKSKVKLKLNFEVKPEDLNKMYADVLILAIGGKKFTPPFNIKGNNNIRSFEYAITNLEKLPKKIAIIGGGTTGAELALEIGELNNAEVFLIDAGSKIASKANKHLREIMRQKFEKLNNITIHTNSIVKEINNNKITLEKFNVGVFAIDVDEIIVATGMRPQIDLVSQFYGKIKDTYYIGDCKSIGQIQDAVFQGYSLASNV